jgi:hypothetical protein
MILSEGKGRKYFWYALGEVLAGGLEKRVSTTLPRVADHQFHWQLCVSQKSVPLSTKMGRMSQNANSSQNGYDNKWSDVQPTLIRSM